MESYQTAKTGDNFTVRFKLDEYCSLTALTVNGEDALESEGWDGDNQLSLILNAEITLINAEASFNGEIIEMPTGVAELESGVKISVENGLLVIRDAQIGQEICIYNVAGQVLKNITATSDSMKIQLSHGMIYIVRVGSQAVKLWF